MRIKKTVKAGEVYVLEHGTSEIPIFDVFRSMMVFVLIALAYNVGVYASGENVKLTAYLANKCEIEQEGTTLIWNCLKWEQEIKNQQYFKPLNITNTSKYIP